MHRDSCLDPLEHFTQLLNFVIDVVYKLALAAQAVRPVAMVVHVPIHVATRAYRQPSGIAPVCPLTGNVLPAAAAIVRHGMVKESASQYRMNMRVLSPELQDINGVHLLVVVPFAASRTSSVAPTMPSDCSVEVFEWSRLASS